MIKKVLALALSVFMTASFAGCQSSGETSSTAASSEAGSEADTSTAEPSGGELKIGVVTPLTGGTSTFGQSAQKGLQLLEEQTNAAGGILGQKVKFLIQDDEGKAASAVTVGQKLINNDQVAAIIGPLTSTCANSLAPICQQYKIPMVTGTGTNIKITQNGDYIFRTCFIDPFQGKVVAKFAIDTLKAKTAAVLYNNGDDYSKGLADAFQESFTGKGGKVVASETYNTGDKDFNAQLTNIAPKNPDVLFLPDYYNTVAVIARQARSAGMKATFLGGDGWDSTELFSIGGDAVDKAYFSNHYSADDTSKEVVEFIKAFKAKYNEVPDAMAALNYDAGKVLLESIKEAGKTDGESIKNALKSYDGTVVSGHITFDKDRNAVKSAVIIKTENGKEKFATKIQAD